MSSHNLPHQPTAFIGRSRELEDVIRRLTDPDCRLLTLVGPGGIGKTRLALEAARRTVDDFAQGVTFVDLQPVAAPNFLATAIADALSLTLSGNEDPARQLLHYLQDKAVLLVLDNFEQLADGAQFLGEVLEQGPAVRLLVTSRAALHLQEEWLYPLSGLPYPPADQDVPAWAEMESYDAVQLFVERARRVRPDFVPDGRDLLRICRLVEGRPLALELAASWTRSLDCATIAAEIERGLGFLASPLRNVPERHRSMQAVFAHSWDLLTADEQAVFPQLSLFHGGFRRQAAQAVAGATLSLLTALVDKSLLRWEANGRYHVHELLRQYAADRLAQSAAGLEQARGRHATYYLDFIARRNEAMLGGQQREAAAEIGAELDNIRAAWQWAVKQQMVDAIGRAVEPFAMFCHVKSRYLDAAKSFDDALQNLEVAGPAQEAVKVLLLSETGWIAIRLGQFEKATRVFSECRALYKALDVQPLPGQATDPLLGLSILASIEGDYARAGELAGQAHDTATDHTHLNNLQTANYQLASIAYAQGHYQKAQSYAQAAYDVCRQTGDRWFMAYCLNELGRAARALGDYAVARRHFEACYDLRGSFSDSEGMALALNNLGDVALRLQQIAEAEDYFARSVAVYREISDKGGLAAAYHGLGRTALARGDSETARGQLRQALTIAADIHFTPLLLAILATTGQFLLQTGRVESGLALLALVQQHVATDQETKTLVRQLWHHYQATISPAHFAAVTPLPDQAAGVAAAQSELSAAIPSQAEKAPAPRLAVSLVEPLTERELEVLLLLAQGLTNREIAERLTVVVGTVKAHNNSIYGKLGVSNRVQAVARARELNLL